METLLSLLPGGWLTAIGGGAAAIAVFVWRVFRAGVKSEENRQRKRDVDAMQERLEMSRESSDIDRRARDLPSVEAKREEAKKWSR